MQGAIQSPAHAEASHGTLNGVVISIEIKLEEYIYDQADVKSATYDQADVESATRCRQQMISSSAKDLFCTLMYEYISVVGLLVSEAYLTI